MSKQEKCGICPRCGYDVEVVWAKITPAQRRYRHPLTDEGKRELVEMHLLACNGKHPATWEKGVTGPKPERAA